jgi:cytoskeleton protein RodZ
MTDQPDTADNNRPSTLPYDAALFSVGAALREARMRQGLSVAEISNRIKFAPRQIEALEADDFAHLPEIAFVRGFVRSYARSLQLDPANLLAALPPPPQSEPTANAPMTVVPYSSTYLTTKSNMIWLAAALVIAVLLVIFVWLLNGGGSSQAARPQLRVEPLSLSEVLPLSAVPDGSTGAPASAVTSPAVSAATGGAVMQSLLTTNSVSAGPVVSAAAPSPILARTAPPAAVSAAPGASAAASDGTEQAGVIRLTFNEDSWVEIKDKFGKTILSQLGLSGSEQTVGGHAPFTFVIGHASGVELHYKGQPVDLKPYTKITVARFTLE